MKLTCPIRGELNINDKAKDGITFTEETRRIECVKLLLQKGIPKDLFDFEKNIWDLGSSGRNHLRADILVYTDNAKDNIFLIAEIKRDNKNKKAAMENQLIPSCIRQSCKYGIYYDSIENIFISKNDNYKKEYSLLKFPLWGYDFDDKPLVYEDLQKVENITELIDKIEQILHNVGKTNEEKYDVFFKFIISKYYDEREKLETSNVLDFQIADNTINNIKQLYERAKKYYDNDVDNAVAFTSIDDNIIKQIVNLLQNYSLLKSRQDILQTLFMKFAQYTLKTELDQFYTPIDIVDFIVSILKINNMTKIIDPAGGSADFLVGCLKKNIRSSTNIYYNDCSKNACEVAKINMIINGDGRTHIEQIDSIKNSKSRNNQFDIVITNPPFGDKTVYNGPEEDIKDYVLFNQYEYKQLGVLFIERAMNLLKTEGILCIIMPHGYLTNPSDKNIRKYLLENFHIIAYISLPEGAFKVAKTGVKAGILIVRKEKNDKNYNIFTDVAENIGFDFKSKKLNKLYRRIATNGEYELDNNNAKIPLSDFPSIASRFKKFIYDNSIDGFEYENNEEIYDYISKTDLLKDEDIVLRPETNRKKYSDTVSHIINTEYLTLFNAKVHNKSSVKKNISKEYHYIDIGNLEHGNYLLGNKMRGWQLPNRAKLSVKKYDICISKLKGSIDKFCMILHRDTSNIILTNGCYIIEINDETERLSFYKFLFTEQYKIQMESLATGSIMLDVKENDIKNKLVFPKLSHKEFLEMKEYIRQQELFINMRSGLY